MTTKPEHDAPEQPTAANYTAGDSFAKIAALLNGRIRSTLLDTSNGIDSPASMSTAANAVRDIDRIEKLLEALAAIPAGELPPLPPPSVPAIQRGYPGMKPSYTQPDYYTAEQIRERDAMWQSRLDALAASHRERSGQGEAVGVVSEPLGEETGWCAEGGWPGETRLFAAPPSQPADKPAGQAVTDAWHPIGTAPKDGETRILLCEEGGDPYFGYRPIDCQDDAACNEYGIACYPGYWSPAPASPRQALAPEPARAGDFIRIGAPEVGEG